MTIILYRSRLCPRCHMAGRALRELTRQRPDLLIEEREFFLAPLQALRAGVTMIPAIRVGDEVLSGLILGRDSIAEFLRRTGCL